MDLYYMNLSFSRSSRVTRALARRPRFLTSSWSSHDCARSLHKYTLVYTERVCYVTVYTHVYKALRAVGGLHGPLGSVGYFFKSAAAILNAWHAPFIRMRDSLAPPPNRAKRVLRSRAFYV